MLRVRDGSGRLYGHNDTLFDPMPADFEYPMEKP